VLYNGVCSVYINNGIMAKPSRPHAILNQPGPETGIPLGMALLGIIKAHIYRSATFIFEKYNEIKSDYVSSFRNNFRGGL